MSGWSNFAWSYWTEVTPELMLASLFMLTASGYPFAFILGALALGFGVMGSQNGQLDPAVLASLPGDVMNDVLLNPALICIPVLILLVEFVVSFGVMAEASKALKGLFDPDAYRSDRNDRSEPRTKRQKDNQKGRRPENRQRSIAMALILPAALMMLLLANVFELSPDVLTLSLMVPAAGLFAVYLINWLLELWRDAYIQSLKHKAGVLEAVPCDKTAIAIKQQSQSTKLRRPWGRLIIGLLVPSMLVVVGTVAFVAWKLSLFSVLCGLCLLMVLLSAFQLKLKPTRLLSLINRTALASASLFAVLMMAVVFLEVFMQMGGADHLAWVAQKLALFCPLPALLACLSALILLGLLLDWIIMATLVVPLILPLFAQLDFGMKLEAGWSSGPLLSRPLLPDMSLTPRIFQPPEGLWLASLIWLCLLTALVTFSRQQGEIAQKELVSWTGKIKDSPASLGLFMILQIIGLVAIIIIPQLVLWLPSVVLK